MMLTLALGFARQTLAVALELGRAASPDPDAVPLGRAAIVLATLASYVPRVFQLLLDIKVAVLRIHRIALLIDACFGFHRLLIDQLQLRVLLGQRMVCVGVAQLGKVNALQPLHVGPLLEARCRSPALS